jgi:breast carcinoma-amplified sequence 3
VRVSSLIDRLKPVSSLFVISDVNGNLVEYVLDVIVEKANASNASNISGANSTKASNDSPIHLKLTPKAQWPLQRYISSDELRYPLHYDNPLINNYGDHSAALRKQSTSSLSNEPLSQPLISYSPSSHSPPISLTTNLQQPTSISNINSNDWIKMIEVNTHIGPHRRLFMGPQFVFKTFNSNITTTMLNPASSSLLSENQTPIIDLSGDIELNSLE